jgi:hypothetical protein
MKPAVKVAVVQLDPFPFQKLALELKTGKHVKRNHQILMIETVITMNAKIIGPF